MQNEINLLASLPKSRRDVKARAEAKDPDVIAVAKRFAFDYWDGDRHYGYGGYRYDKRWIPVAKEIVEFFQLKSGDKILDVGCGKGFLLYDLSTEGDFDLYGLDISKYALRRVHYRLKATLVEGTAEQLPYPDKYFDLVLSINTLHNLPRNKCIKALKEIERVGKGKSYVVVDAYRTLEEKELFQQWVLTAETHGYPNDWLQIFYEAGYRGHFSWNLM